MTCANNCRGVNPNAVVIGGTAVLAAAAVTPLQVLDQESLWSLFIFIEIALTRCSHHLGSEHLLLLEVELPLLVREQPEDVNRVDHVG